MSIANHFIKYDHEIIDEVEGLALSMGGGATSKEFFVQANLGPGLPYVSATLSEQVCRAQTSGQSSSLC
jgi:hypothetical protein